MLFFLRLKELHVLKFERIIYQKLHVLKHTTCFHIWKKCLKNHLFTFFFNFSMAFWHNSANNCILWFRIWLRIVISTDCQLMLLFFLITRLLTFSFTAFLNDRLAAFRAKSFRKLLHVDVSLSPNYCERQLMNICVLQQHLQEPHHTWIMNYRYDLYRNFFVAIHEEFV